MQDKGKKEFSLRVNFQGGFSKFRNFPQRLYKYLTSCLTVRFCVRAGTYSIRPVHLGSSIFQHYALNYATNICFTFGVPFKLGFHARYRVCRLLRGVREKEKL